MARSSYKVYDIRYPYFVTSSIVNWIPLLSKPDAIQLILDCLRFHQKHRGMTIYSYVIMKDHIHMVVQSNQFTKNMRTFKSYTARKIIDLLKREGYAIYLQKLKEHKLTHHKDSEYQFWQEGYHPKQIVGDDMMIQKIEYIHNNPVLKGYVKFPNQWLYSSASNYEGGAGLIPVKLFKK